MNTSVNELLSNPAFRPLVLLDVLAVFLIDHMSGLPTHEEGLLRRAGE